MRKQINAMYKSGRLTKNSFIDSDVPIQDIEGLQDKMDEGLNDGCVRFCQISKILNDSGPRPGYASIQRHSTSVEEHSDDVTTGVYFQCVFLWTRTVTNTGYDNRPEFVYFDSLGKKHRERVSDGDSIIFNPRKSHSLIFYGDEVTLALRSVVKCRD